jgi:muramoyltetrapeptide carboxypeptidase
MTSSPAISRTKPPALRPGDTVGIIAPASNIKREWLDAGCAALQKLGYKTFYFDSILEQDLYFAGSVDRRVHELEEMFVRDEVRAMVCARGGYGANYLLERIDLQKVITPRFSLAIVTSPRCSRISRMPQA